MLLEILILFICYLFIYILFILVLTVFVPQSNCSVIDEACCIGVMEHIFFPEHIALCVL